MGYKVQKGDGWYRIAKNTGMDVNELLKLNNATLNTVIHPGQELKTSQPKSTLNPFIPYGYQQGLVSKAKQAQKTTPVPYRPGTSEQQIIRSNAKSIQTQLLEAGYDLGKYGADGKWGKVSQTALDKALSEGYKLEGNKLVKPGLKAKPQKPEAKTVQEVASDQIGQWIGTSIDKVKGWFTKGKENLEQNPVQSQFIPTGYSQGLVQRASKPVSEESIENVKRVVTNFPKAPVQTILDTGLYFADRAGAPTNATNYLRDLVVSIPYRAKSTIHAGVKTLTNDKSFKENYGDVLANPGWLTRNTTINPLINTNNNFNEEELAVIREMAGNDFNITNEDIKRVSEDGKYGAKGSVFSYFTAPKIVQTALGQTSGNKEQKLITDAFDVNTQSEEAKRDNANYLKMAKENPRFNYETIRATMPYFNMIDIIPDQYKIQTKIKYEK